MVSPSMRLRSSILNPFQRRKLGARDFDVSAMYDGVMYEQELEKRKVVGAVN